VKDTKKQFDKTEDDLKALQSMGQIIGEVLRQLDEERCAYQPPKTKTNNHPTPLLLTTDHQPY
jgi:ATP-dependent 26S proteasome regulatory subunit|tara:strand:+ start:408 stop:596 length:189 start_codon:yes stop_codon:yes gene_type:complete